MLSFRGVFNEDHGVHPKCAATMMNALIFLPEVGDDVGQGVSFIGGFIVRFSWKQI